ncbi:alternate-type signal peptide domain-containing protein [Rhodococcus sp. IEGM 1381]|uniref:alternate-type signal peptide domain-containing protein n=1 Tax=Rhodococcus sp. IEGM 1381 TaxID=3047085 RepID=UPI0024B70D7D|nr:alternate-type signal peptide domain-containing protein [Rhodococcus sp. IEGM 1381]MDI9898125.1 alternate-type signal peptide domain-containing protein [Rhodococcus sp. IEGM 1381]
MNKATKGAIAAGAAAVLLLGGLGSLAVWNDSETLGGGTITSGDLSLTLVPNSAAWFDASDDVNAGADLPIADIAAFRIVPGDTVAYTARFNIQAEGNNLTANLTADISNIAAGPGNGTTTDPGELLDAITTTVTATGATSGALPTTGTGGAVITAPNSAAENQVVTVRVEFTFAIGTDGILAQNQNINLSAFTLDLTQIRPLVP